jgi:endonuclease/exonuclease/phosphatase family metal-dependent hydrolase
MIPTPLAGPDPIDLQADSGKENLMTIVQRVSSFFGALLLVAAATPIAAATPPQANNAKTLTVMTRNLYLGADVAPAVAAALSGDPAALVAAVSEVWGKVQFTDFPARADGIAREIAAAGPDLIGLQEAELWRSQTPADFVMGNALDVEYDFVEILLDALEAQGLHYAVVAEEIGLDVELPGFLSEANFEIGLLSDIRLTEREVILARTDLKTSELKLSNAQNGHFVTNIEFPDLGFVVLRGWASVDAKVRGKDFRFLTTHLEADDESIREAQAIEIIAGPANTSLPVVLAADANSNANGDVTTPAYASWIGAGFTDAWFEAHPGEIVSTCCADELLLSPVLPVPTDNEGRLDLVLYRGAGAFSTLGVNLLGTDPATDRVFNGVTLIWPSDHAGVAAKLQIHN